MKWEGTSMTSIAPLVPAFNMCRAMVMLHKRAVMAFGLGIHCEYLQLVQCKGLSQMDRCRCYMPMYAMTKCTLYGLQTSKTEQSQLPCTNQMYLFNSTQCCRVSCSQLQPCSKESCAHQPLLRHVTKHSTPDRCWYCVLDSSECRACPNS